jgi:hypothetical protein
MRRDNGVRTQGRRAVRGLQRTLGASIVLLACAISFSSGPDASARSDRDLVWRSRRVDDAYAADGSTLTRTFIDVRRSGRSSILYCSGPRPSNAFILKFARGPNDDGSFDVERVDAADHQITGNASLEVDSRGRPGVSYVSGIFLSDGILKYAERRHGAWSSIVVDPVKATDQTAITVDARDRPIIAYTKLGNELRIAIRKKSGWVTSPVSSEQVVALDVAVDHADHPRIAYVAWDGSAYVLRLATFDGVSWSFDTIDHVSSTGIEFDVDLLLDDHDLARMVYPVLEPVRGMAFSWQTSSGWHRELISKGDLWQPTAAFDRRGHVNVVYYEATDGALIYGKRAGGDWARQRVADNPSPHVRIGRESSIAFDGHDRAHVSYYVGNEFTGTTLRYAVGTPYP